MVTKKKGVGRPKSTEKVKTKYIYLTDAQEKKILKRHKTLTDAVKDRVLAEC